MRGMLCTENEPDQQESAGIIELKDKNSKIGKAFLKALVKKLLIYQLHQIAQTVWVARAKI